MVTPGYDYKPDPDRSGGIHPIGFRIASVLLAATLLLAVAAGSFTIGRRSGVRHAIEDSIIWTVDIYDPDDPESSAWEGYDQLIYIELDGELYAHGMYQG